MENIKKNMEHENQQAAIAKMGNKNVLNGLKVRTITAKLRDAVIISLNDESGELGRFKNIELPDALRELLVDDYQFSKTIDGKLEFELYFKPGVLPKEMPEPRPKVTREEKAAAKAAEAKKANEPAKASMIEGKKPDAPPSEPSKQEIPAPTAPIESNKAVESAETAKKPDSPATALTIPKKAEAAKPELSGKDVPKVTLEKEPIKTPANAITPPIGPATAAKTPPTPLAIPAATKPIKK